MGIVRSFFGKLICRFYRLSIARKLRKFSLRIQISLYHFSRVFANFLFLFFHNSTSCFSRTLRTISLQSQYWLMHPHTCHHYQFIHPYSPGCIRYITASQFTRRFRRLHAIRYQLPIKRLIIERLTDRSFSRGENLLDGLIN